jgi:hypothetical protein
MRMVTEVEIARNMRVIENTLITIKKRGASLIKITIINKMMAKNNSSTNKRLKSNRKILKKKNKKKQILWKKVNRKKNPKKFLIYNSNFKNTNLQKKKKIKKNQLIYLLKWMILIENAIKFTFIQLKFHIHSFYYKSFSIIFILLSN